MKKILLLLAVLLTFTAQAQTKSTEIEKQLKLNTVNLGAKSDSILVRGADKLVKYVPQSSIGASASYTLQNLVDADNTIYDNNVFIKATECNNCNTTLSSGAISVQDPTGITAIVGKSITFYSPRPGDYSGFFHRDVIITSHALDYDDQGIREYKLPIKAEGVYTIATLDDINPPTPISFQLAYDGGASFIGEGAISFKGSGDFTDNGSQWGFDVFQQYSNSAHQYSELRYNKIEFTDSNLSTRNTLDLRRTTSGNTTYKLPEKVAGIYTLATLDDIPDVTLSSITTTFTTNDGKTVTVTNGVITNIE